MTHVSLIDFEATTPSGNSYVYCRSTNNIDNIKVIKALWYCLQDDHCENLLVTKGNRVPVPPTDIINGHNHRFEPSEFHAQAGHKCYQLHITAGI